MAIDLPFKCKYSIEMSFYHPKIVMSKIHPVMFSQISLPTCLSFFWSKCIQESPSFATSSFLFVCQVKRLCTENYFWGSNIWSKGDGYSIWSGSCLIHTSYESYYTILGENKWWLLISQIQGSNVFHAMKLWENEG